MVATWRKGLVVVLIADEPTNNLDPSSLDALTGLCNAFGERCSW